MDREPDGRPHVRYLAALATNAPSCTTVLYVAPYDATSETLWPAFSYAHDVVRRDSCFDIALARRVETAALAGHRWNAYLRERARLHPHRYLQVLGPGSS